SWAPAHPEYEVARDYGTLFARNGLSDREHTLRVVVEGKSNPLSKGTEVCITSIEFSHFEAGTSKPAGMRRNSSQRWIFGYPERTEYVDGENNAWRPATEWVVRGGNMADSVAA